MQQIDRDTNMKTSPNRVFGDVPAYLKNRAPAALSALHRMSAAMSCRRVEFEPGRAVAWRSIGAGPPIVLLHGGHGSWMHWIRNIDVLARQHTLWIPDIPGLGDSDLPLAGEVTTAEVAAILVKTMNAIPDLRRPFGLVGFSLGGLVAAYVAAQNGELVRCLMLIGPAGLDSPRRQTRPIMRWLNLNDPVKEEAALRNNMEAVLFSAASRIDDEAWCVHTLSCRAARLNSKKLATKGDLPAVLTRVQGPVLVIWGEGDVTATPNVAGPSLATPNNLCSWDTICDAGHWAPFEAADAVNQRILSWFRK
jgi:2-hydroxy-6-oxonona-2,4-dienedioate hydrolase